MLRERRRSQKSGGKKNKWDASCLQIVICGAMELRYFWIKESSRSGLLGKVGLCTFSLAEVAEVVAGTTRYQLSVLDLATRCVSPAVIEYEVRACHGATTSERSCFLLLASCVHQSNHKTLHFL